LLRFRDALTASLKDPDVLVRGMSAAALGRVGKQGAPVTKDLVPLLGDNEYFVRDAAAVALRSTGQESAAFTKEIAALLANRDGNVRRGAADLLRDLGAQGAPVGAEIIPWLSDPDPVVRDAAAVTLRGIGNAGAPATEAVAKLLVDPELRVRTIALSVLDQWGNPDGNLRLQATMLAAAAASSIDVRPELRAHLRLWSGGNAELQRSVTWLGKPDLEPMPKDGLSRNETRANLAVFLELWDYTVESRPLRTELAGRIAQMAKRIPAPPDAATAKILTDLAAKLADQPENATAYEAVESVLRK
jgi:hypothetical protein